MNKSTVISIFIGGALIIGSIILAGNKPQGQIQNTAPANNVSIVDGKQIIEIHARGGFQPRTSIAKAGMPTILRFETNGTFDCSSSVRIPSMNIAKFLSQSGSTDIDVGTSTATTLQGTCGMGMYPFEVDFQS